MKRKRSSFAKWRKKALPVLMGTVLLSAPFSNIAIANGQPISIKGDITLDRDIQWISSHITKNQHVIFIDVSQHFSMLDANSLNLEAISNQPNVVAAAFNGKQLELTLLSHGQVTITITATDSSGKTIIDNFQVTITKLGDVNGDGVIAPADALFVFQVINGKITLSNEEKMRLDMDGNGQITANDATLIMNTISGKTNVLIQNKEHFVTIKDKNDAPIVHQVGFQGSEKVGQILTGLHQYIDIEGDAEGDSRLQWYRGSLADGTDKVAIPGANSQTYTLQNEDANHYIFFEATPVAVSGVATGSAVTSEASGYIAPYAPDLNGFVWAQGSIAGTTKATTVPSQTLKYVAGTTGEFSRPHVGDDATAYTHVLTVDSNIPVLVGQHLFIVSVDLNNNITGWTDLTVESQNIKRETPPALVADSMINHLGMPIELTFVDDVTWRGKITDVLVDSVSINGNYTSSAGSLMLNPNLFDTAKSYEIKITATEYEDAIVSQVVEPNAAPVVNQLGITGTTKTGSTLTGNYVYDDSEGDIEGVTRLQWYRGSLANGTDKVAIPGANSQTYTLQNEDANYYIFFEATPVAISGMAAGSAVTSATDEKIAPYAPDLNGFVWAQGSIAGTTKATTVPSQTLKYVAGATGEFTRPHVGDDATAYTHVLTVDNNIPVWVGQHLFIVSVDLNNNITGWTDLTVESQNIKRETPPALVADSMINHLGMPIELTFVDNATWRGKITDVLVDSVSVNGNYTSSAGSLMLNPNLFDTAKSYEIKITATDYEDAIISQVIEPNAAPVVNQLGITGTTKTGSTLTGNYVYDDSEGDSESGTTYQWYRGSVADGTDKVAIQGATSQTYVLQDEDADHFIFFEVMPAAGSGTATGDPAVSQASEVVTVAPNLSLAATPFEGPLTEANLNASIITLTITGDTFKDGIQSGDFTLNHAPQGMSIALVNPLDNENVMLLIENDSPDFDSDITNFSVTANSSALTSGEEVTTNDMTITAIQEPTTPNLFISELLDGGPNASGGSKMAIELFNPRQDVLTGYKLEVYQWVNQSSKQKQVVNLPTIDPNLATNPYLILEETYYEFMDEVGYNQLGVNDFLFLSYNRITYALVLKDPNGNVIDVLGDPNSITYNRILPGDGTLIRKPGHVSGMDTNQPYQWKYVNQDILKDLRKHSLTP